MANQSTIKPVFHYWIDESRPEQPEQRGWFMHGKRLNQAERDDLIAEIKAVDIADYIAAYIPSLKKSGANYTGFCKFHHNTKTWHCNNGCGGGDIIAFVMKNDACDYKTAVAILADYIGKPLDFEIKRIVPPVVMPKPNQAARPDVVYCGGCCGGNILTDKQIKENKQCQYCQVHAAMPTGISQAAELGNFRYIRKKFKAHELGAVAEILAELGCKIVAIGYNKLLILPRISSVGAVIGYQQIDEGGYKLDLFPKEREGFFYAIIGDKHGKLAGGEGLATCISAKLARPELNVVMCGNSGNLPKAAAYFGKRMNLFIADKDNGGGGQAKANQAAKVHGAHVWQCPVATDFNDLHAANGLQAVADSFERDIYHVAMDTELSRFAKKHGLNYQQVNMASLEKLTLPERGAVALLSKMATGKTKYGLKQVRDKVESCLSIAHLRSLTYGLASGLSSVFYQDTIKGNELEYDFLACCLNSITKYERYYEAIQLDEFDAGFDVIANGGTLKTDEKRMAVFNSLRRMVAEAKIALFASATFLPEHLESIVRMTAESGKPLTIIENIYTPDNEMAIFDLSDFTAKAYQAIANGKNIFWFIDSKDKVKAIEKKLKAMKVSVLSIHGGKTSLENMAYISSGDYRQYQVVLGSPSVLAGVSFEAEHFHEVFIQLDGKTKLSPLACCQALGRVRTLSRVNVTLGDKKDFLSNSQYSAFYDMLIAKRHSLSAELYAIWKRTGAANDEIMDNLRKFQAQPFSEYDFFAVAINKATQDLNARWQENFIGFAAELGYQADDKRKFAVPPEQPMEAATMQAYQESVAANKSARRDINEMVKVIKDEEFQAIADSDISGLADEKLLKALENKPEKTEAELFQIIKARCADTFQAADVETIKEVITNGLHKKAYLYALLRSSEYAESDTNEAVAAIIGGTNSTANVQNESAKRRLLAELTSVLGVTINENGDYDFSGAIEFTAETSFNAIDKLIENNRYTLGFERYQVLGHKAVLRLGKQWLGFNFKRTRLTNGGYKWQAIGLTSHLIAIGGLNVQLSLLAELADKKAKMEKIPYCVDKDINLKAQYGIFQANVQNATWNKWYMEQFRQAMNGGAAANSTADYVQPNLMAVIPEQAVAYAEM